MQVIRENAKIARTLRNAVEREKTREKFCGRKIANNYRFLSIEVIISPLYALSV